MIRARSLCAGVSTVTLAWASLCGHALAADAAATAADASNSEVSEVVVVGVRKSLENAIQVKRTAETVVDSISATDIGAFPDKSASEALQRVPGVSVGRLQSSDDSTHPSGEPVNVLIRGLPQVRTELNGRDSFSADSGRGLNFNDVSPELLSRIDAYKNQTADLIEGGIAGSVDLRTRLPFDHDGLVVTGSVKANYGDRSTKWTPEGSVMVSDTWNTSGGKIGLLAEYAYSHVITQTDSVIMDKIDTYCSSGATFSNGVAGCSGNPFGGSGWAFAPDGIRYSQVDYDRTRHGYAFAGEYQNNSGTLHATLQYTDNDYHNAWLERASHAILDGTYYGTPAYDPRASTILTPANGTGALVFGSNGMLQSGTLTQPYGSWSGSFASQQAMINTGSAVPGLPFVNYCPAGSLGGPCTNDGLYFQNESRDFDHREGSRDVSAHIRWDVTPRLHADFDAQYTKATVSNNDILVATGSMANYQYSTNGDGTPQVTLLPGSNVNYAAGGLANPTNYWIPFIQGHVESDKGDEYALRGDVRYDFDKAGWFGGWLDSLQVGVRYSDRNQTEGYSTFNWTPIAASWNCNGPGFSANATGPAPYGACGSGTFKGYGAGIFGPYNIGSLYNGQVYPNGSLVFVNQDALTNYSRLMQGLSGANTNSPIGGGYTPICDRPGTVNCFLPSEVEHLREETFATYAMLRFGGPDKTIFGNVTVDGNVGLRAVETRERGVGAVELPTSGQAFGNLQPCGAALGPNQVVNPSCYLTSDVSNFANGGSIGNTYTSSRWNILPSFNVRFGLDRNDIVRFAFAEAMSRPDIGLLRNYVQVNAPFINTAPDSPYVVYNSSSAAHTAANVVGYNWVFPATAGNAALKPMTADQIDISFERYMSHGSLFSFDVFWKQLHNTFAYGQFNRNITNNGATETVQLSGPVNVSDGGTLTGFEVNYQTFFTFLPGIWSGLGAQVNYTYVNQSGINNSNLIDSVSGSDVGAVGAGQPAINGAGNVIDSHKLAGISKHTFNIVGLYEKGPIGIRLAYNWRSQYLTQNLDCCIGLPVFQKAAGFLDGSIRYSINPHVELALDITNILGTTLVYQQEIFGDSPQTPGGKPVYVDSAWSRADRRVQLGVRAKF